MKRCEIIDNGDSKTIRLKKSQETKTNEAIDNIFEWCKKCVPSQSENDIWDAWEKNLLWEFQKAHGINKEFRGYFIILDRIWELSKDEEVRSEINFIREKMRKFMTSWNAY